MKFLISFSVMALASTSLAVNGHKCHKELKALLKNVDSKEINTAKDGTRTSKFVSRGVRDGYKRTVEVIEKGSLVTVKSVTQEKMYGWKADTITEATTVFEDLNLPDSHECRKLEYNEKQSVSVGGEVKPFTDFHLSRDNCAKLRASLLSCSDSLKVPTEVATAMGGPIKNPETAMNLFVDCATHGLEETPDEYRKAIFNLIPPSAREVKKRDDNDGPVGGAAER